MRQLHPLPQNFHVNFFGLFTTMQLYLVVKLFVDLSFLIFSVASQIITSLNLSFEELDH